MSDVVNRGGRVRGHATCNFSHTSCRKIPGKSDSHQKAHWQWKEKRLLSVAFVQGWKGNKWLVQPRQEILQLSLKTNGHVVKEWLASLCVQKSKRVRGRGVTGAQLKQIQELRTATANNPFAQSGDVKMKLPPLKQFLAHISTHYVAACSGCTGVKWSVKILVRGQAGGKRGCMETAKEATLPLSEQMSPLRQRRRWLSAVGVLHRCDMRWSEAKTHTWSSSADVFDNY